MTDTIFALATAPGRAAVAVVRLSGPAAGEAVQALAAALPPPRRASLRTLHAADGEPLDAALVLWMPGPHSFTGENAAELHLHGGPAVTAGVARALVALGLRLAEPGEFTRRAFENGRLDLTAAEAVADLVDAEGDAQRRQALAQLGGSASRIHAGWREALLDALAHLEAAVDFPDEDLPEAVAARARAPLLRLQGELQAASADRRGERVREGLRIALVGAPNAGKSTLLNALLGRDMAIVTSVPGTTRDVLEGRLMLAGVPAMLADTAGLRETADVVEAEGVRRARAWAEDADLRLLVLDRTRPWAEQADALALHRTGDVILENKADLPAATQPLAVEALVPAPPEGSLGVVARAGLRRELSAHDVSAVAELRAWLDAWAAALLGAGEPPAATRLRHRQALEEASQAVGRALDEVAPELAAEDVRLAVRALERLSGRIEAEEVLGRVFSTFCIGK